MAESLLSVGLDVGTTSTQMVVSRLWIENKASAFSVPELQITDRQICYRSPVHFTPLLREERIDGAALGKLMEEEYRRAGITRDMVDTGAVIITGETSRKENARAVLENLSHLAGDFVVATAGPDLESRLAARGAGAVDRSLETEQPVLHMDIGGGTSNLALIRDGRILDTGCFNIGGRLLKFSPEGRITYVSPVLEGLQDLRPGDRIREDRAMELGRVLAELLEMAAGLRQADERLSRLVTREGKAISPELLGERPILSFSGGVADCMEHRMAWNRFGDLGPCLGRAILESRLGEKPYFLGRETIRATVIGAGCHSTRLSGSTVFLRNVDLPIKNLPAAELFFGEEPLEAQLQRIRSQAEGPVVLALPGGQQMDYGGISALAEVLGDYGGPGPLCICLQQDMAKALGQALALRLGPEAGILCLDGISLREGSYLDVGEPVGPAVPVVIKTLVLENLR